MGDYQSKVVIVLGMHRSGTSAITRAVNLLGVDLGEESDLVPAQSDNPEGFWEHAEIVQIHERILATLGISWDTTSPLEKNWWEQEAIQSYKAELRDLIGRYFKGKELWGWKDPRTCLLLPLWLDVFKELQIEPCFVLALRNPVDVAASLRKRNGYSADKSFGIWNQYTLFSLLESAGYKRVVVQYDHFLENWESDLRRVASALALEWPDDDEKLMTAMSSFIRPNLRHSHTTLAEIAKNEWVPKPVIELYELCLEAEQTTSLLQDDQFCKQIEDLCEHQSDYFRMIGFHKQSVDNDLKIAQVFWEAESPYNETDSQYESVEPDGEWRRFEMELRTTHIRSLRLDPTNFRAQVKIRLIELLAVSETGATRELLRCQGPQLSRVLTGQNILELENDPNYSFVSLNEDPQLILPHTAEVKQTEKMIFAFEMSVSERITPELTEAFLEKQSFDDLANRCETISQDWKTASLERDELKKAAEEKELQLHVMTEAYGKLELEMEQCMKQLQQQVERNERLELEITQKHQEIDRMQMQMGQMQKQNDRMQEQNDRMQKQNDRMQEQNDRMQAELTETKNALLSAEAKLQEVFTSSSWKITKPFRTVRHMLQKK